MEYILRGRTSEHNPSNCYRLSMEDKINNDMPALELIPCSHYRESSGKVNAADRGCSFNVSSKDDKVGEYNSRSATDGVNNSRSCDGAELMLSVNSCQSLDHPDASCNWHSTCESELPEGAHSVASKSQTVANAIQAQNKEKLISETSAANGK